MNLLFSIQSAAVQRPGSSTLFRGLNWQIKEGETWAITGPTGSGKTTLAELLLGRVHLENGSIEWPFIDRMRAAGRLVAWPSDVIEYVAFREESRLFSYARHYYQERFNFSDPLDDPTLDQFLHSGADASDEKIGATAATLGIESLRSLSLIKLSNGQMRRARIARGLLSRPELFILDDPFLGLDGEGRAEVSRLLGELVQRGQRLLLITRTDMIPGWVTDVLQLSKKEPLPRPLPEARRGGNWDADRDFLPSPPASGGEGERTIELRNITVAYGERVILSDITWTVRAGERWALLGANGAGKSTLLSLLCGDHPQAYANDVWLFGRRRGSGESIWDIKRRIGLVSPELHLYFHEPLTAAQTAATGFFDVVAYRATNSEQDATVRDLFEQFGIADLAERPFARLSTGEQRLVLLVRALVKRPELLILDEPFQGLDAGLVANLRDWLDAHLDATQTLLFVTHHELEIPRSVTHRLHLDAGQIIG